MTSIVIVGDSLAFNRPDSLNNEQRWPALLREKLSGYKVNNLSMGSSTSNRFKKLPKSLLSADDILIVQIGVVDCAPRLFNRFENKVISILPKPLSKKVIAFFKKRRVQSSARAYVDPLKFENNLLRLFNKYKDTAIYYIKILPASTKYMSSNPAVSKAIDQYNSIIDVCANKFPKVQLISFNNQNIDDLTLEDGYHLNASGHLLVSSLLAPSIQKIKK
jgi:acyl-CoA thioesterase-1